jgi:hypothetical protein
MRAGAALGSALKRASSCPHIRYLAERWRGKAHQARKSYERWWRELATDVVLSIRYVFGEYAEQALAVAECESGLSRHAHNGQYLGIFQMGDFARSTYGHGETFLAQARAAHRYFVASGRDWSPWACQP